VPGDVGINYNPKVWHCPLLVNTAQDFLVIDRSSALDKRKENLKEFFFQGNDKSIYIE
jgi:ureidoglycolate hydrolase